MDSSPVCQQQFFRRATVLQLPFCNAQVVPLWNLRASVYIVLSKCVQNAICNCETIRFKKIHGKKTIEFFIFGGGGILPKTWVPLTIKCTWQWWFLRMSWCIYFTLTQRHDRRTLDITFALKSLYNLLLSFVHCRFLGLWKILSHVCFLVCC